MAKATFERLDKEKKERLQLALREFFEETPVDEINVSNIVKALGIARGSFYQYFEDLDDCYFTVLKEATGHVHTCFLIYSKKITTTQKPLFGLIRNFCWRIYTITI